MGRTATLVETPTASGLGSASRVRVFYAYAFPEPASYRDAKLPVGHYDASFGEWILPYEDVRTSADPDKTLLDFLEGTYGLAADLGTWDRASLDVDPHQLDVHLYRGADRTTLY